MPTLESCKIGGKDKRNRLAAVQNIQLRVDSHWEKLLVPTFGGKFEFIMSKCLIMIWLLLI